MACGAGLGANAELRKARGVRGSRRKSSKSEGPPVRDLEQRLGEALKRETQGRKREAEAQERHRGDQRYPASHQPVALGCQAGLRRHRRERLPALRRGLRQRGPLRWCFDAQHG